MAQEVGRYQIRVNAICPGFIDTYRMDDVSSEERTMRLKHQIPLGRAGTGEDIAHMTVFLCSEHGRWITGQAYNIDGGVNMA